jgi:hypothetical protein
MAKCFRRCQTFMPPLLKPMMRNDLHLKFALLSADGGPEPQPRAQMFGETPNTAHRAQGRSIWSQKSDLIALNPT